MSPATRALLPTASLESCTSARFISASLSSRPYIARLSRFALKLGA